MKRLTRKKRRLGEYSAFGYSFECEWTNPASNWFMEENDQFDKEYTFFWDKLSAWCEARGFCCGGGSNNKTIGWILESFSSKSQKYQSNPTERDKDELVKWVQEQREVKSIKVTDRLNLWHSDEYSIDKLVFEWVRI